MLTTAPDSPGQCDTKLLDYSMNVFLIYGVLPLELQAALSIGDDDSTVDSFPPSPANQGRPITDDNVIGSRIPQGTPASTPPPPPPLPSTPTSNLVTPPCVVRPPGVDTTPPAGQRTPMEDLMSSIRARRRIIAGSPN